MRFVSVIEYGQLDPACRVNMQTPDQPDQESQPTSLVRRIRYFYVQRKRGKRFPFDMMRRPARYFDFAPNGTFIRGKLRRLKAVHG
jgi:hypothetical protein